MNCTRSDMCYDSFSLGNHILLYQPQLLSAILFGIILRRDEAVKSAGKDYSLPASRYSNPSVYYRVVVGNDDIHLGWVEQYFAFHICCGHQHRILDAKCSKDATVTTHWFPMYASLRYTGTLLGRRCQRSDYHFFIIVSIIRFGCENLGKNSESD